MRRHAQITVDAYGWAIPFLSGQPPLWVEYMGIFTPNFFISVGTLDRAGERAKGAHVLYPMTEISKTVPFPTGISIIVRPSAVVIGVNSGMTSSLNASLTSRNATGYKRRVSYSELA